MTRVPPRPSAEELHALEHLHRWLSWERASALLSPLAFFAAGLIVRLLMIGAVLFTPYLIWRLIQVRRFGWLVAFLVLVGNPALVSLTYRSNETSYPGYLLTAGWMIAFYIYTWVLRGVVGQWLIDLQWQQSPSQEHGPMEAIR